MALPDRRPVIVPRILLVENEERRHGWFKARIEAHLPKVRLVWCRTSGTALNLLEKDEPDHFVGILLDHDLDVAGLPYLANGRDVVDRIITRWPDASHVPVLVHSANEAGGPHMRRSLVDAGFSTVWQRKFGDFDDAYFEAWMKLVKPLAEEVLEEAAEEAAAAKR